MKTRKNREREMLFSCFSKARTAVKGLPNRECSYTELTL